ncbi:hypothetical protein N8D56_03250 [Devosia sp. A8/3-2]|nr:hypothetical protein N8D56_03250 [Devosia sp. A8/3-2]
MNANNEDLDLLEAAHADAPPARQPKIQGAIVSILARTNLDAALSRVVEAQVDKVEPKLVDLLFSDPQSIPTAAATLCVSAKSETVRLRAVKMLYERGGLSLDVAQVLLTDSNHEVRLFAAEGLRKLGVELDGEQLKKALQIVKPNAALGLFSRSETDSTYYDRYQTNRLLELDLPNLRERAAVAGVFDGDELSALYSKYGAKVIGEIRAGLKDRFKSHFEAKVQAGLTAGYISPETLERVRKLEDFARGRLTNAALASLCKLSRADDTTLVRSLLDGGGIDANADVIRYLGKHGDWSDVDRIKALGQDQRVSLFETRTKLPDEKAEAILLIGKERIIDVLVLDAPNDIRLCIAKKLPRRAIRDLRDEVLLTHLKDQHDEFRIVFSLRCVESLPRGRVAKLLDRYVDSTEHRFYNTIHWLDLGASMPNIVVKAIAAKALVQH